MTLHAALAALLSVSIVGLAKPVDVPPVTPVRVVSPYRAAADEYAPGHRGVDLAATPAQSVRAPIAGVVTFVGSVAGRPVVVLGDGVRAVTLEPVLGSVAAGRSVSAGQVIGSVGTGGHCGSRCIHLGLRVDGAYVDPLRLRVRLAP